MEPLAKQSQELHERLGRQGVVVVVAGLGGDAVLTGWRESAVKFG
jgi:hypothetical protein